jgi:pyruvate-formate lyase-activating enzyme
LKYDIESYLLANGIAEKSILNYESYSYRRSCPVVEAGCMIGANNEILACCGATTSPRANYLNEDSNEKIMERVMALRNSVIADISTNNDPESCQVCNLIKARNYSDTFKIRTLVLAPWGGCQFRCCYCNYKPGSRVIEKKQIKKMLDFLEYLESKGCLDETELITVTGGEITVNPFRDKFFEKISKYYCVFFSNAELYSETIAESLSRGRCSLTISVDAGTRQTFAAVRGRDCFSKVRENILKYANYSNGENLQLKYIIIPGSNDTSEEAVGFAQLAIEANAMVILSRDCHNTDDFDKNIASALNTISAIKTKCESAGLVVTNQLNSFYEKTKYEKAINELFNHKKDE